MPLIEYIGDKPHGRVDTVNDGATTVWTCKGDVQEVPDAHVPALLKHPNVWRLVERDAPSATPNEVATVETVKDTEALEVPADGMPDLDAMEDAEVRALARQHGLRVDLRARGDRLRQAVREQLMAEA